LGTFPLAFGVRAALVAGPAAPGELKAAAKNWVDASGAESMRPSRPIHV